MEITTTSYKRSEVVKPSGRVDTHTAPKLQDVLENLIEKNRHNIALEMSDVEFLSSKGLWVLTETHKKCRSNNGKLVLVNVPERIASSFELVGMNEYFEMYSDITEAVGSF